MSSISIVEHRSVLALSEMTFHRALTLAIVVGLAVGSSMAYIIDGRCSAAQRQAIIDAAHEALSIAEYAAWRVKGNDPSVIVFKKQMLGNAGTATKQFTSTPFEKPCFFPIATQLTSRSTYGEDARSVGNAHCGTIHWSAG